MAPKMPEIPNVDSTPSYLVDTITTLLGHVMAENEGLANTHDSELFTAPWKYEWVKVPDYMDRLKEWVVCGPESYVVAMCLLKRLERLGAIPFLDKTTVHRVYFSCFMLAVKTTEDETLNNADFAKVACIQLADLNAMEVHLLKALNFACCVSAEEFTQCKRELVHLDLLFTKAKNLKSLPAELVKFGPGSKPLLVSSLVQQLNAVPPKRYLAASLPRFKDRRNSIADPNAALAAASDSHAPATAQTKITVQKIIPFWNRRMSLEAKKSQMPSNAPAAAAAPAVAAVANKPAVLVRQDSV